MKIYKTISQILAGSIVGLSLLVNYAHAALIPSLSLYSATVGNNQVQITVFGADPNAPVLLYYPSVSSLASANIGTTNSSGYLTTTVDATTYGITSGALVYVMVDGQASAASSWPSVSNSGGAIPLSQTSLIMTSGQSQTVSASVSAALTLSNNSNPSVASVSISGNQITVTAFNTGTANLSICASGLGCNTIAVTVQSSSVASSISFTPSTITVGVGQSQTVAITGSGNYYVSANANPGFVSANLSGAILTVGGVNAGSSNITVCSSGTAGTTCGTVNVIVSASNFTAATTTTSTPLTFSQSNITLSVGQSQAVTIYGGAGGFYVSNNSSSQTASANVNGNSVNIIGLAFGGDNITICSVNGQCGIVYAYVSTTPVAAANTVVTTAPAITSFSVSSNDQNGSFIGAGNALTLNFTTNQSISIPSMLVSGAATSINGSGNGPYTATYTITGNESQPIPVVITFSNPAGSSASAYFWIGSSAASTPTSVSGSTASVSSVPSAVQFTQYLYNGSTGAQVTALQKRLLADGVYSGPVTGTFGALTEAGVKAYQKKHGIDQLGVVGPATRALLNQGI